MLTPSNPQLVSYYVAPYEPPSPFPRCLEQHVEEALIHKAMESLKIIKINPLLLKEIRQTDDHAKHMKNLVENKLRTSEDEDVKINTKCSVILQNQLPPKEQDPWSFTLLCSIGKLTFNALDDLGASISVMPLSMFKRLGIGGLKPINMTIEIAYRTQSTPMGIAENLLIKINKFIFLVYFIILDMVEEFRISIILGRPLMATTHTKVDIFRKPVSLEVRNQKDIFKTKNDPNKLFLKLCMPLGMKRAS
ncbi:hypothetical protein Tco_1551173 [Tanacetum coccineum]